jgi:hypothetical protein
MLNNKKLLLIIIGILIIGSVIAIFHSRSFNELTKEDPPKELKEEIEVEKKPEIKVIEKIEELTRQDDKDLSEIGDFYSYQIADNARVVFKVKEFRYDQLPYGDVLLEKEDKDKLLLEDVSISSPEGSFFSIYSTDHPLIFLINKTGGGVSDNYYLDSSEEDIVFFLRQDYFERKIIIEKEELSAEIGIKIDDQCGQLAERKGKEAKIVDLTLNNKRSNSLNVPIIISCIDPGGIGPIYFPDPVVVIRGVNSDFSKLLFSLIGKENNTILWRNDFYLALSEVEEDISIEEVNNIERNEIKD